MQLSKALYFTKYSTIVPARPTGSRYGTYRVRSVAAAAFRYADTRHKNYRTSVRRGCSGGCGHVGRMRFGRCGGGPHAPVCTISAIYTEGLMSEIHNSSNEGKDLYDLGIEINPDVEWRVGFARFHFSFDLPMWYRWLKRRL